MTVQRARLELAVLPEEAAEHVPLGRQPLGFGDPRVERGEPRRTVLGVVVEARCVCATQQLGLPIEA